MNNNKGFQRFLSLILAFVMILGFAPIRAFAQGEDRAQEMNHGPKANPGPNWDDDGEAGGTVDGDDFWPLPQGVRLINAQNGGDPLNTLGFTYRGHYTSDSGREVVVLNVSHKHSVSTGVWTHFVMRFPKELHQKIDWDKSFISHRRLETDNSFYIPFTDSSIPGQKQYTKSFSFKDAGVQYRHYKVNLVLKEGNTWENSFAKKNQVIQLRLFDNDGSRVFSTSVSENQRRNNYKYTLPGYNSYTKSATIPGESDLPKDWILSTTTSMQNLNADRFYTSDSVLQLDKEKGVVRVIYLKTNGKMDGEYGYDNQQLALRQTFDKKFVKYLDLTKKDGKIGTIRTYNPDEKEYGKEIEIFPYHLNGIEKTSEGDVKFKEGNPIYNRSDGSVFIQACTQSYDDLHAKNNGLKAKDKVISIRQPANEGYNINYNKNSNEANVTVFEYYIKPELIEKDLINSDTFVKNFFFDTRYITNNGHGMAKFTTTLKEDLVIPGGYDKFFNLQFTPELSLSAAMSSPDDFILNLGGPEGISKSWKHEGTYWTGKRGSYKYLIPFYGKGAEQNTEFTPNVGLTLKAGQEISVYVPANIIGTTNSALFTIEQGANYNKTTTVNDSATSKPISVKLEREKAIVYNPMYIENTVSTVGATAYRLKFPPIVNEIFTDGQESKHFTGYSKSADGVIGSEVKVGDNLYTGKYTFASESDDDSENIFTADGNEGLVKRKDEDVIGKVSIDGKTYDGFKFDIKQQFINDGSSNVLSSKVENLELKKDMPVVFRAGNSSSLDSAPVVEQVQARVEFVLNDPELDPIEKIAPLNKEYLTMPVNEYVIDSSGKETSELKTKAGSINPKYKASGFSGDNLLVDGDSPTVDVDGKTYPNFLNHNGKTYDLTKSDQKEAFMMRQWPEVPERENGEKVIGWTTVKLEDDEKETAAQKFNKIKALGDTGYVRSIDDWKKAEKSAMIFDAKSPIDKHRKVYAVMGKGLVITLHANRNSQDTVTKEVTLVADEEGKVEIPAVYEGLDKENFKIDKHTFVGWTKTADEKIKTTSMVVDTDGRLSQEYDYTLQTDKGPVSIKSKKYDTIKVDASLLDGVKDLYARYEPYIKVIATKEWEGVEGTTGATVASKVGLVYRTAVGGPGAEVIHETAATYYPYDEPEMYKDGELKKFLYKSDGTGISELSWTLPGFNEKGERISYIAIEFDGNKDAYGEGDSAEARYKAFRSNWNMYGISIHPNNTGNAMAKEQNLSLTRGDKGVDAFTGATIRKHNNEDDHFKGYSITVTNTKIALSDPTVENIYDKGKDVQVTVNSAGKAENITTKVTLPGNKVYKVTYDKAGATYKVTDAKGGQVNDVSVKKHDTIGDTFILSYTGDKAFRKGEYVIVQNLKEQLESNPIIKTVDEQPESNHPEAPIQEARKDTDNTEIVFKSKLSSEFLTNPDQAEFTLQGPDGQPIKGDDESPIEGVYNKVTGEVKYTVPEGKINHNAKVVAVVTEAGKRPGKSEPIVVDLQGPVLEEASYKIEDKRIVATAKFKDTDYRKINPAYILVDGKYYKANINAEGLITAKVTRIIAPELIEKGVSIVAFDKLNNMSTTKLEKQELAKIGGVTEPWDGSDMIIYYEKRDNKVPVTIEVFRNGKVISSIEKPHVGNESNNRVIVFLDITLRSGDIVVVTPAKGLANQGVEYRLKVD